VVIVFPVVKVLKMEALKMKVLKMIV